MNGVLVSVMAELRHKVRLMLSDVSQLYFALKGFSVQGVKGVQLAMIYGVL